MSDRHIALAIRAWVVRLFAVLVFAATCSASAGTLDRIRTGHGVVIGFTSDQFPFSYLGPDAKPRGYAIDVCTQLLQQLAATDGKGPVTAKFVKVELGHRAAMVANGTVDMLCGLTTENEMRGQQVEFVSPIFTDDTKVVVRDDSPLRGLDDMRGKRVAVVTGTSNVQIAMALNRERGIGMTIVPVNTQGEANKAIESGGVDALMASEIVVRMRMARSKATPFRGLPEPLERRTRGIMVRQDDPAFKEAAQAALKALAGSGALERTYQRWFLSPIAPEGVNLDYPMAPRLQAWIREAKRAH